MTLDEAKRAQRRRGIAARQALAPAQRRNRQVAPSSQKFLAAAGCGC